MQRLNKKMFLKTQIEWRKSKEGKEKQISKMQNKMRKLEKTYINGESCRARNIKATR